MANNFTQTDLQNLITTDERYQDLENLIQNSKKTVASIGRANLWEGLGSTQIDSAFAFLSRNGIDWYSTPAYIVERQFEGLTMLWKPAQLQNLLDLNSQLVSSSFFPLAAKHFAMAITHQTVNFAEKPDLYRFIAYLFADLNNSFLQEKGVQFLHQLKGFEF